MLLALLTSMSTLVWAQQPLEPTKQQEVVANILAIKYDRHANNLVATFFIHEPGHPEQAVRWFQVYGVVENGATHFKVPPEYTSPFSEVVALSDRTIALVTLESGQTVSVPVAKGRYKNRQAGQYCEVLCTNDICPSMDP